MAVCPGVRYVSVALLWASRKLCLGSTSLCLHCAPCPAPHADGPFLPSGQDRRWLPCLHGAGPAHRGPSPATRSLAQAHSPSPSSCAGPSVPRGHWCAGTGRAQRPERRSRDAGDVSVRRASQQPLVLGAASAWLCTVRFRDEQTETLGGWICPSSHSHCVAEPGLDPKPRRCVSCGKWGRWTRWGDGGPKCPG